MATSRQIDDFLRFKQYQFNIIHLVCQKDEILHKSLLNYVKGRSQAEG